MKSKVIQDLKKEMERLNEEIRKLRETETEKIKLERQKQTLEASTKYSAEQLEGLDVDQVGIFFLPFI